MLDGQIVRSNDGMRQVRWQLDEYASGDLKERLAWTRPRVQFGGSLAAGEIEVWYRLGGAAAVRRALAKTARPDDGHDKNGGDDGDSALAPDAAMEAEPREACQGGQEAEPKELRQHGDMEAGK